MGMWGLKLIVLSMCIMKMMMIVSEEIWQYTYNTIQEICFI